MQITANSVRLLSGGNVIKQGDETPFQFQLMDEKGNIVDLQNASVLVKIANYKALLLEKNATVNEDNTVSFSLSDEDVIGYGTMRLEFSVVFDDLKKEIFPADGWQEIKITPSLDNLDIGDVAVVTVEAIKAEYQQQIDDFTDDVNSRLTNVDEQAAYAQAQGDYAKAEANRLVNVDAAQFDTRVTAVEGQLSLQNSQTQTLTHGLNVIESDQASPLKVEFYGNSLANISSPIGACENVSLWNSNYQVSTVLDSTNKLYGNNAIKVTQTVSGSSGILRATKELTVGKYYVWLIETKNVDASYVDAYANAGGTSVYGYQITSTSKYGLSYVKFSPTQSLVYFGARIFSSAIGSAYVDGGRLFEVSSETYNKIGVSLTDADVERMFPYVDSVQHVQNPVVKVEGENLLPPFTEWNLDSSVSIIESYKVSHGALNTSSIYITKKVSKGVTYNLSSPFGQLYARKENGAGLILASPSSPSFTADSDFNLFIYYINSDSRTESYNPMLSIGSKPKPFVPRNPSYLFFSDVTLAGIEGNKKDISWESEGKWYKQKWFETDVAL